MIGTKLAHYEITAHLGSGGMGDVYQANDTKLRRSVAVRFLSEAFARDENGLARFKREARLLASLNHPNIAAIYGLEDADEKKFLVMELVPGQTLAERIKRGTIPVEEALEIARQIAEALEAAHEKAIVHRDLKPANIKITPDGKVKVRDFGMAKAFAGDEFRLDLSNSPTLSMTATQQESFLARRHICRLRMVPRRQASRDCSHCGIPQHRVAERTQTEEPLKSIGISRKLSAQRSAV